jgi:hypothetical protein
MTSPLAATEKSTATRADVAPLAERMSSPEM